MANSDFDYKDPEQWERAVDRADMERDRMKDESFTDTWWPDLSRDELERRLDEADYRRDEKRDREAEEYFNSLEKEVDN
jgi:hypothetical protein